MCPQWEKCVEAKKAADDKLRANGVAPTTTTEEGLKVKPCPNPGCRTPTTKISGCMYLNCTKCGFPWCWQCGQWGPDTHHVCAHISVVKYRVFLAVSSLPLSDVLVQRSPSEGVG